MTKPASDSQPLVFRMINNSLAFVGGEMFYRFVNFFASIMVARSLGGEAFGQFSFIYVYLTFFEVFVQFGMNSILVRQMSRDHERAGLWVGNAILLRIGLVLVAFPVMMQSIKFFGYPLTVRQGVFLASFQLFLTIRSLYEAIFRVHLAMIYPAVWNAVRALVNVLLVAVVALYQPYVPWFILSYLASGLVALLGIHLTSRRWVRLEIKPERDIWLHLLRESAPLLISAYLTIIYYRVDMVMLSLMKTFTDVGLYSVATRFTEALTVLSNALLASFFPVLSEAFQRDRVLFERHFARAFFALHLIGSAAALGGVFVSQDLVKLFFGSTYAAAGFTLSILCWQIFFAFPGALLANVLIAGGRQVVDMWISFFLAILNVGLNLFFIPSLSHRGAALATVLTEMVGTILYFWFAMRDPSIRLKFPSSQLLEVGRVNAAFLAVLLGLKFLFKLPVIPFVLLALLGYAAILMLFKVVTWNEWKEYFSFTLKEGRQGREKSHPVSSESG